MTMLSATSGTGSECKASLKPNFIIAGAAKCGTTYLLDSLALHPRIAVSEPKETLYFSNQKPWGLHERGQSYYARCFANRRAGQLIGEASPHYFVDPASPGLIAAEAPETKLIFLIRDPVSRAVSHYIHLLKGGHDLPPLAEFVLSDDERAINLRAHSEYLKAFARFDAYFHPSNMLILLQEEMALDPRKVLLKVTDFLGLESLPADADLTFSANASGLPRSALVQRLIFRNRSLRNLAKLWLPRTLFARARRAVNTAQGLNMSAPPQITASHEELAAMRARMMPDPDALETRVGVDLSAWRGLSA